MSDKMLEEFEAWYEEMTSYPVEFGDDGNPSPIGGPLSHNVTLGMWVAWKASRAALQVNACAGMADPAAEIAELKRQRDSFQLEAINCHEMLCSEIERTTNLIAELGFVSEYATKSVIGFCKGDEKSIFEFSKFMEGIFNRYDIELSSECEELINEGKFTKPKNNLC